MIERLGYGVKFAIWELVFGVESSGFRVQGSLTVWVFGFLGWGLFVGFCDLRFGLWVLGLEVWGLGSRVRGLGFGAWGLGFGAWGLGFGFWGLGFEVWGLGFGVWSYLQFVVLGFRF